MRPRRTMLATRTMLPGPATLRRLTNQPFRFPCRRLCRRRPLSRQREIGWDKLRRLAEVPPCLNKFAIAIPAGQRPTKERIARSSALTTCLRKVANNTPITHRSGAPRVRAAESNRWSVSRLPAELDEARWKRLADPAVPNSGFANPEVFGEAGIVRRFRRSAQINLC